MIAPAYTATCTIATNGAHRPRKNTASDRHHHDEKQRAMYGIARGNHQHRRDHGDERQNPQKQ